MNVVIVEDEVPATRHLQRLLNRFDSSIQVLAAIPSVKEAVQWFTIHRPPDLIFLDIHLADGLSFEIFEQVNIQSPVIFTTAYDQYALRAFKVNSIDYLLKPIDLDDLQSAFEKKKLLSGSSPSATLSVEQIQAARQMLSPSYKKRFLIKIGDLLRPVRVEDIHCFYSRHKMTYLLTAAGKSYPTEYSLNDIENLVDPQRFFRVSRQYIVQADAIAEVITFSNSRLKIKLHTPKAEDIVVSRERVAEFKEFLAS